MSKTKREKKTSKVAVLIDWCDDLATMHWLMYGGRVLRVYDKGKLDPRIGKKKLPFFDDFGKLVQYFHKEDGRTDNEGPVQVAVSLLPELSFSRREIREALESAV